MLVDIPPHLLLVLAMINPIVQLNYSLIQA